ncbi:MAG TPA: toprim domain-containing protein, partial [Candidatus Gracilibacteria bacterium]
VAFSGRDILGREKVGKYINSPENPVYHKSATLFGLYQARKKIREHDQVIFVEGNFDVVTMHEKGFEQTVATCGTALTEDHLRTIKRLTPNIILAFDTDLAGKKATLRAMEMVLMMDLNPFILVFDEGKDIDEFLQNHETSLIGDQLKKPKNALEFLLEKLLDKFIAQGVEGRKKILMQFFYFLNVCPRPMERDYFLSALAEGLKMSKSVIDLEFEKYQNDYKKPNPSSLKPKESVIKTYTKEEQFLGFMFSHWEALESVFRGHETHYEKVWQLLTGKPKTFFQSLVKGPDLEHESILELQAWAMDYENKMQEENPSLENIQKELNLMIQSLEKTKVQQKRLEEAKALGEKLKTNSK